MKGKLLAGWDLVCIFVFLALIIFLASSVQAVTGKFTITGEAVEESIQNYGVQDNQDNNSEIKIPQADNNLPDNKPLIISRVRDFFKKIFSFFRK